MFPLTFRAVAASTLADAIVRGVYAEEGIRVVDAQRISLNVISS